MPAWKNFRCSVLVVASLLLSGCGAIAKNVITALLEGGDKADTRACHISGPRSHGLNSFLELQEKERASGSRSRTLKLLMVHGIGNHIPGYSGRLTEHLMRELGLDVTEERSKEIIIQDPNFKDEPLGSVRIIRFTNKARSRELLFYELTWSKISEKEKAAIKFDDSGEYAFRRAELNKRIKAFLNSHISDPMIYLGPNHIKIQTSVRQAVCWMTARDWEDYNLLTEEPCDFADPSRIDQIREDDFAIISHSLGSRIAIDTLQWTAELKSSDRSLEFAELRDVLQNKTFAVYMLANQLPLLELGREPAAVRGEINAHCKRGGKKLDQRMMRQLNIYAFTDPNDILSYAIPAKFADEYLDSRLCPSVTNITLNVAQPTSVFGMAEFADPLKAHSGYDHDARVIGIIAHGIGTDSIAPIVRDRCTWMETTTTE